MFVREYGLVRNQSDSERFVRLVRWETRWSKPDVEGYEECTVVPVARELTPIDVSRYGEAARIVMVPTVVTELRASGMRPPLWPREAGSAESEELRRARIRLLRQACHMDPVKGAAEPTWLEPGQTPASGPQRPTPKEHSPFTAMDDVDADIRAFEGDDVAA